MIKILVSACLLGLDCRYDGKNCYNAKIEELRKHAVLIPVCPEQMGGLSTPRVPAEIKGDRLINREGADVTSNYQKGAEMALKIAQINDCRIALLKQKSPSCGHGTIYDGTFSSRTVAGEGNSTRLFLENGMECYSDEEIDELIKKLVDKKKA